ncbi:ribosome quality control complex subunit TCF25 isoform X2 [Chroicocephalus ridibundus]|uniref:ribosome quality control complex subunit TCF25 isoform X2 n=1 Tax=Chroicocephalus ridibundus TaxID=1192867 RepID=UPI002FDC8A54
MSRRALRRLRGEQRGQEEPGLGELGLDPGPEGGQEGLPSAASGRARAGVSNRFELITAEESEDELPSREEQGDARLSERDAAEGNNKGAVTEESKGDGQRRGEEAEQPDQTPMLSNKPRKKKKKRKTKKTSAGETLEDNDLEDIDSLLEKIEDTNGLLQQTQSGIITDSRPLLYIEHRNLNPENELKRYFGARAVLGDQRQRQRQCVRGTWLTTPQSTWPRYTRTGIVMELVDTKGGVQYFTFEHHRKYQEVQLKFLENVETMDPNSVVPLLQALEPYHVDSLLLLSDVCRMQEDQEMARELVEQALYSLECSFHPLFSLTSGTCRLDYRRPENRSFFLALFKHLMLLEKRGCPRTALEFCKLILSLDPENDPLCVLLLIDFLSLRAREYTFLTRMFQEVESHRNLSQLPNFAFSVPLAYFFLSQQEERSELEQSQAREKAARLIQLALIMFPSETKTQHNPQQHARTLLAWVLLQRPGGGPPLGWGCLSAALAVVSGHTTVLLAGLLKASCLTFSCSSYAVVGSLQCAARCQGRVPFLFRAECSDKVSPGDVLGKEKESILPVVGLLLANGLTKLRRRIFVFPE